MDAMVGLGEYAVNMADMLTRLGQPGWTITISQDNNKFVVTHPKYKDMPVKCIGRVAFMCESYANSFVYADEDNWLKPKWEATLTVDKVTIKLR